MKLQPYTSYKSLDIEWNQSAPSHWRSSRLKFDSYIKARVGWHGLKSDEFTEEGPYLITGSDFSGKVIDWSKCYHCEVERYEQDPYIQLKDDDLLITKDGTIGKVILTGKLPDKATLNSGVFVLRPLKERYDTKYYYWLMQSSVFHGFVEYYRTGSTIAHLYQETFCNLPYAIPPLDEQAQIATFLDRETAKIDRLIEKQQRLIELLEEKRQAVISHAVTKGLNPNAAMKDSGVEWLGEVPEHWLLPKLVQITSKIGDGLHSTPEYEDGTGYYFVNGNNLNGEEIVISEATKEVPASQYHKHFIPLGNNSLLLSINGTIGNTAIFNGESVILGKSAAYINCSSDLSPHYLLYYLQSNNLKHFFDLEVTGTTIFNLSLNSIRQMKVCLPPHEEQQQIIRHCKTQIQKYIALSSRVKRAIELLKERRTALISAAVTGKIDVRDQVPQDVEEAVAS